MKLGVRVAVWALVLCATLTAGALLARRRHAAAKEHAASVAAREARAAAAGLVCPTVAPVRVEGHVQDDDIDELSGLVASRRRPGMYWVHNDSGDDARAFAIDVQGHLLAELTLSNADATDIEDIALERGKEGEPDVLYLADMGDNFRRREKVQLYRIAEPVVPQDSAPLELTREAQVIEVAYEDGAHDAEALLLDPRSGDLFLVTKASPLSREEWVGVYRVARAALLAEQPVVARKVASIPVGPATAGDVAPDGSAIIVRNYRGALYWPRAQGDTIAQALAKPACRLPIAEADRKGEAIGFTPDMRAYVTSTEGGHSAIFRYAFVE
jgi:hypothetical protein